MGIIGTLRRRAAEWVLRGAGVTVRDPRWDLAVNLNKLPDDKLTDPYRQNPLIYACANAIAKRIASAPFALRTGTADAEKTIENGELYARFRRPNPNQSHYNLWEAAGLHLVLGGNALFVLDRVSPTQVPREIWCFGRYQFEDMPIFEQDSRVVRYWKFRASSTETVLLEPHQVVWVPLTNPDGGFWGMGPMEAARNPAEMDWLATLFNKTLLRNGGSPAAKVQFPAGVGVDKIRETKAQIMAEHFGPDLRSRFRLLALGGGATYEPIEYSQRDASYIEGRKMSREEILYSMGVPAVVIGIGEKAGIIESGAQAYAAIKRFWGGTIIPYMRLIEEGWRSQFFDPYDNERTWGEFDLSQIEELQEERSAKLLRVKDATSMGVPFNVANEKEELGYEPIPGGDVGFISMGLTPIEFAGEEPEPEPELEPPPDGNAPEDEPPPPPPAEDDEDESENEPDEGKKAAPTAPARPWHKRAIRPYTQPHVLFHGEWVQRMSPIEQAFSSRLRTYIVKVRSFLNLKIDDAMERFLSVGEVPTEWFDISLSFDEMLRKISKAHFKKVAVEMAPLIESNINGAGVPFVFDPDNPAIVEFLKEKEIKVVAHVNQEGIREGVRAKLVESQVSGGTMEDLRENLLDVIGDNRRRALTIARTETAQASNGLEYRSEMAAGIKTHQWIANLDDRARDSHLEQMALGDWPVGTKFPNGCLYPGDIDGPPEEVINCFVPGTVVSGRIVAGSKAWYSGAVYEVTTRSGRRFTVTPNHPVLTSDGWRPAHRLAKGSYLFGYGPDVERSHTTEVPMDDEQGPARIEEIFGAMAAHGLGGRVSRAADFHGDARFCKGKIDIVTADGMLGVNCEPHARELGADLTLESSDPLPSGPGVLHKGFLRSRFAPRAVPRFGAGDIGPLRESLGTGLACAEPGDALCFGPASHVDAFVDQRAKEGALRDPVFVSQLLEANPGFVVPDEVVQVRQHEFSGHVYDLQSSQGWIVAEGVVQGNCRCRVMAIE